MKGNGEHPAEELLVEIPGTLWAPCNALTLPWHAELQMEWSDFGIVSRHNA
jgi:hypothetical protein